MCLHLVVGPVEMEAAREGYGPEISASDSRSAPLRSTASERTDACSARRSNSSSGCTQRWRAPGATSLQGAHDSCWLDRALRREPARNDGSPAEGSIIGSTVWGVFGGTRERACVIVREGRWSEARCVHASRRNQRAPTARVVS